MLSQFLIYHKLYVNNSAVLTKALEDQLLFRFSPEYQHLPYTHSDAYSFCNLKTFSRSDTEAIHKYASDQLDESAEEIAQMTNEELIGETDLQNCEWGRDALFSIIVMKDEEAAEELIGKVKTEEDFSIAESGYFNDTDNLE